MFDKLTAYNFYCYDEHLINDRNIIKSGWKPDFCFIGHLLNEKLFQRLKQYLDRIEDRDEFLIVINR